MATFKVGQRVKLARPYHPENEGVTGRIASMEFLLGDGTVPDSDCTVLWDDVNLETLQHTSQLEPIIPEGMLPAEWEECLWMPEHIKELVMT